MTTETKTEARERMDNEEFELRAKATVSQLIPPVAWLVEEASRARASEASLAAEVERLLKLAYLGDHYFPDLTWKARCEETVGDLRKEQAALSALRAEHQRVCDEAESWKNSALARENDAATLSENVESLQAQLAAATKRAEIRDGHLSNQRRAIGDLQRALRSEKSSHAATKRQLEAAHQPLSSLRAALAASEEKARGLGELWVSADEWLAAQENRDHDLWNKTTARLLAAIRSVRALSPSAGPAPETKARLAIERMDGSREVTEWAARCGDQWNGWSCALVAGHKGEHHDGPATWQTGASPAPRVGAESEAKACGVASAAAGAFRWLCGLDAGHEGPHSNNRGYRWHSSATASEEPKR